MAAFLEPLALVRGRLKRHEGGLAAAAIAFYSFLALIPTLAALIGLYGLLADPEEVADQLADALDGAPAATRDFLTDQMTRIAESDGGAVSFTVVVSLVIALFSASGAVANLIKALNGAYEFEETRKPWTLRGLALLLLFGGLVLLAIVIFLMAALPPLLADLGVGAAMRWVLGIGRFVLLGILMAVSISLLYRLGPDFRGNGMSRSPRLVTVGGLVATVLFVLLSALFSLYTANFGSYGETYGPLATIIVLLIWFQLSALAVVVGAEVDAYRSVGVESAESEH